MENSRKKLGLFLIILGFLIMILLIYFTFIKKDPGEPGVFEPEPVAEGQLPAELETGTTTPADRPLAPVYDPGNEPVHRFNSEDLSKRAMLYVERLGSYSSQSDYGNFLDLKIYMTASMKAWIDRHVADLKAIYRDGSYYGIETKALTSEVVSFSDAAGTAKIIIVTERRESRETIGGGASFRQSITLDFRKVNGEWLIDGAYWD